jgi:hypothetical protein
MVRVATAAAMVAILLTSCASSVDGNDQVSAGTRKSQVGEPPMNSVGVVSSSTNSTAPIQTNSPKSVASSGRAKIVCVEDSFGATICNDPSQAAQIPLPTARPAFDEIRAGTGVTYLTPTVPRVDRRVSDCAARRIEAARELLAAAGPGDSWGYSARITALAPIYRINCN